MGLCPTKVVLKVNLPISVTVPRKRSKGKVINLTKNIERNLHGFDYSAAKKIFADQLIEKLQDEQAEVPEITQPVCLFLTIYKGNKHLCDIGNYSIIEKFASDALVKAGVLPDDNYKYIQGIFYFWGGIVEEGSCDLEIVKLA